MINKYLSYKQYIHNYVVFKISSSEWKPGDSLPSEYQFANRFKCSRLTVRSALSELVAKGILAAWKGSGYKINFLNNDIMFSTMHSFYNINQTNIQTLSNQDNLEFNDKWSQHFKNILDIPEALDSKKIYEYKKSYYKDNELIAVKFAFLNIKFIKEVYPEEINESLTHFLALQGITINEKLEVIILDKDSNFQNCLEELNWDPNNSYPIVLAVLKSKETWIEISFKIIKQDKFKFIRHYKLSGDNMLK